MGHLSDRALLQPSVSTITTTSSSSSNSSRVIKTEGAMTASSDRHDSFPVGMRVLVVDDDPTCLKILVQMLLNCSYNVTPCSKATDALKLLRGNRDEYDLVISDVYMPDMDGFKLLELVGLEMDLPVIMMSSNGETSTVMKGVTHGACDYLLKPVRIEELRNIWQHVIRKKRKFPGSGEKWKPSSEEGELSPSREDGNWKGGARKRKEGMEEEEDDLDTEDLPGGAKKPRVVWSVDLHQQFVNAVNQLGIEKAVPKRILELMNVPGLTRENVASHLQKYRLYLKRISGVSSQSGGVNNSSFMGGTDCSGFHNSGGVLGSIGDLQALAAATQLSPQVLMSALQSGGRLGPSNGSLGVDTAALLQMASMQASNPPPLGRPIYMDQLSPTSLMGLPNPPLPSSNHLDTKCLQQYGPIGNNKTAPPPLPSGSNLCKGGGVGGNQHQVWQVLGSNHGLVQPNARSRSVIDRVQVQASFANGNGGFQVPMSSDVIWPEPSFGNMPAQLDHGSEPKLEEGALDCFLGSKAAYGILPETLSPSDDLMNALFKQRQERFSEGELVGGSFGMSNMYVK